MATGTAFVIRELNGQRRSVRLIGRALPFRGFGVARKMRLNSAWNPASPEATHNLSGSELEGSSVNGRWAQMYLAVRNGEQAPFTVNGRAVTTTQEAVDTLDSICAEGSELEVAWGGYRMVGRIETFTPKFDNLNDCTWELKFEWIKRWGSTGSALLPFDASIPDNVSNLQRRASTLRAVAASPPQPVNVDFYTELRSALASVDALVAEGVSSVEKLVTTVVTPVAAAQRFIALGESIVGRATVAIDAIVSRTLSDTLAVELSALRFGELVAAEKWKRAMLGELDGLRRETTQAVRAHRQQLDDTLLALHVAGENEDLRRVSFRYYDTPDHWRALLRFNGLASAELRAGDLVRVPYLANLGS